MVQMLGAGHWAVVETGKKGHVHANVHSSRPLANSDQVLNLKYKPTKYLFKILLRETMFGPVNGSHTTLQWAAQGSECTVVRSKAE